MCACVCVCALGRDSLSDNESIWDNMRQFTSPVVVFSIQGQDTFTAQSQRTSISAAASLACLLSDATTTQDFLFIQRAVLFLSSG